MSACDICGKTIEAGQPRFGCPGMGDRTGPRLGDSRHYSCHTDKYGKPDNRPTSELFADLRGALHEALGTTPAPAPIRRPVLAPRVRTGEYNRSENASRQWQQVGRAISEMGKRRIKIECPFCFTQFVAYVWSLSGGGKKCPNCGAIHNGYGTAYPITGNEDLL